MLGKLPELTDLMLAVGPRPDPGSAYTDTSYMPLLDSAWHFLFVFV